MAAMNVIAASIRKCLTIRFDSSEAIRLETVKTALAEVGATTDEVRELR